MNPTLVIGMHRSGTGLLARMLDRLGVFMGNRLDSSHEAVLFQDLNRWVLAQAGGRWDRPEALDDLLANEELREAVVEHLDNVLGSPRAAGYLGVARYLGIRDPRRLDHCWGWKDPRTTWTLPLWEEVTGPPRIVHIVRHGVDVAESLKTRRRVRLERRLRHYGRWKGVAWLHLPWDRFAESTRTADLVGGLRLWKAYVERGRTHVDRLGDAAAEIRFEDLIEDPRTVLAGLLEGLHLNRDDEALDEACRMVRPDRAYAYRDDKELAAFAHEHADDLTALGYAP